MGTPRQQRVAAVILLSTLGMCALFLAQGATNLAGTALIDRSPVLGGTERDQLAVADGTPAVNRRGAVNHEKVKLMLVGPPPEIVDAGMPDGSMEDVGEYVEGDPIPRCEGTALLTASIVSWSRERSLAAITVGGTSRLYREGSVVDGKTVEIIAPHRAIMIIGTRRCYMAMFEPGEPGAAPAAPVVATATAEASPEPTPEAEGTGGEGITNEAMEAGITRQSDRAFTVQRGFLDEVMRNQAEIMRTARVIPHEENGRVVGVKMYGIRRNSVLGRLGVQNGDMLRTMNGFDLSSPDTALEAYTRLSGADALSLSVVRRGQPLTIDYTIQ
jgi:type II secretory pathway component PulC